LACHPGRSDNLQFFLGSFEGDAKFKEKDSLALLTLIKFHHSQRGFRPPRNLLFYTPVPHCMTWIKICGTTNLEDAQLAVDAGADALGFVFYEKSPRNIDPVVARDIVNQLPETVEKVGVFFNRSMLDAVNIVEAVGLTAMQVYLPPDRSNEEGPLAAVAYSRPIRFYMALPAGWILAEEDRLKGLADSFEHWGDSVPPEGREHMPADLFNAFFLDASGVGQPGGTGKPFNWAKAVSLVRTMQKKVRVVVAGGLNPDNVKEAIRTLKPYGVDVVSGVEGRPGKKDPERLRAFVQAVREADKIA
jgi:phosphoribosylanthranilate isomerase